MEVSLTVILYLNFIQWNKLTQTLRPFALLMALNGRNTLRTLRILTTDMAWLLQNKWKEFYHKLTINEYDRVIELILVNIGMSRL